MMDTMTFIPLFSGSSGNAIYVATQKTAVLVDAGLSGRTVEGALTAWGIDPSGLSAILVTHEHSDHIKGVGVLSRRYGIPVYASEGTWTAMEDKVGVESRNVCVFSDGGFYLRDLAVEAFPIPHDAAAPCGYVIGSGRKRVAVATDMGHISKTVCAALSGCQLVLLESNHDPEMLKYSRYPAQLKRRIAGKLGHLSNDDAARMAVQLACRGTQTIVLGHLSAENNREELAFSTVRRALTEAGVVPGGDISIAMALRDRCMGAIQV